jgi:hypothetical protein
MHKASAPLLILLGAFAVGSAQSAPIQITALPYTIVAPGNYVVASYLSGQWSSAPGTSITINVTVPGKVVLNLNGCRLLPYEVAGQAFSFGYSEDAIDVLAGTDITIENGLIGSGAYSFGTGIYVNANATGPYASGGNPIVPPPLGSTYLSNLTINNVGFQNQLFDIVLNQVNGATVKNCGFFAGYNGIVDNESKLGNTYVNNSFTQMSGDAFTVSGYRAGVVQQRCVFSP